MSKSTAYGMAPGERVDDRYEVLRPHRRGGLSVAFEVQDDEGNHFELQHFPPSTFESVEQAHEFAGAWEPWKSVVSDAVLRVREVVEGSDGGLLLITDVPRGETLRSRLDASPRLEPADAISLGRQLLVGLAQLHSRELVHGDVKPNTIYVRGDGAELQATMVDGGITAGLWMAKGLGDKTALIGTPYYAPAEQFGGESPDVQSDLYNVATVMFEVIAGRLPWKGSNFLEVFQAKISPDVPSLRSAAGPDVDVTPELDAAIAGGLAADPKARYTSAQAFIDALDRSC